MLTLRQEWINRNQSWCVRLYRLKLYLLNAAGNEMWSGTDHALDPRRWLPGPAYSETSQFILPRGLAPGNYELRLALVDETGTPSVLLAVAGADEAKRYSSYNMRLPQPK